MTPTGKLLPFRHPGELDDELSAEALVQKCAAGDRAAVGALFDRFATAVYRFLSRLVGAGHPDLDDLVQTTFLEVMRAAPRFRMQSAVKTWIFAIAVNVTRHHRRSERRRHALCEGLAEAHREPRPVYAIEANAERQLLLQRLSAAVASLPHELRTAFVMCELEELPGLEVARVLGWRPGTLWRRLHEARKILRTALAKESR